RVGWCGSASRRAPRATPFPCTTLFRSERNGTLDQVAQSWAEWMAANQTLQHNPNYRSQIGSGWSAAGENIIRHTGGASMSSSAVTSWMVDWWKNSSVHRANMLNSKYTHVGVGYSMGPGGPYAVLLLGGRWPRRGPLATDLPDSKPLLTQRTDEAENGRAAWRERTLAHTHSNGTSER